MPKYYFSTTSGWKSVKSGTYSDFQHWCLGFCRCWRACWCCIWYRGGGISVQRTLQPWHRLLHAGASAGHESRQDCVRFHDGRAERNNHPRWQRNQRLHWSQAGQFLRFFFTLFPTDTFSSQPHASPGWIFIFYCANAIHFRLMSVTSGRGTGSLYVTVVRIVRINTSLSMMSCRWTVN